MEKAYDALLNMEPEITLPEPVRKRAEAPILRMLKLSK
jgi:quinolinate synthase